MPLNLAFLSFSSPEHHTTFVAQTSQMAKQLTAVRTKLDEKAAVKKVIDDFMAALCRKDVKAMMSHYAAELVAYDVKPPYQTKGAIAWKHTWEACIDYFPESFSVNIKDLKIHVGGDVAVSHYIFCLTGTPKEHDAAQTYIRTTTAFKKMQGKWKIVHEHGSVPFNPHTRVAVFTMEP